MKRNIVLMLVALLLPMVAYAPAVHAKADRFKQWIAPLECTKSTIDNGTSITVILTPEQCDDVLHPKPPVTPPHSGGNHDGDTPGAPNTGFFQDPIIGFIELGTFVVLFGVLLLYARRRNKDRL